MLIEGQWGRMALPKATAVLLFGSILATLFSAGGSVSIVGAGGPYMKPMYDQLVYAYKFVRDSVDIEYLGIPPTQALVEYQNELVDFINTDLSLPPGRLEQDLVQIPIIGSAIVVTYNLPTLAPTDPPLVLDRTTLAKIWFGNITTWNHEAIINSNPLIASRLPNATIRLAFKTSASVGMLAVFSKALSSMSPDFAEALAAAGGKMELMDPSVSGNAVAIDTEEERGQWAKDTVNGMTYMNLNFAIIRNLSYALLVNKAGNIVYPNSDTVHEALDDFKQNISTTDLSVNIVDAPGRSSWPISYASYVTLARDINKTDCSVVEELLLWLSWTQLNDLAMQTVSNWGYISLTNGWKRRLIDGIGLIKCRGKEAFSTAVLLGLGGPFAAYQQWASDYMSRKFKMKYFPNFTTGEAIRQMIAGDIDFGAISIPLTSEQHSMMPDVLVQPMIAYALACGYNIPGLSMKQSLVMDMKTLAYIYMNKITKWNHKDIAALNPNVILPDMPIITVVSINSTAVNWLVSKMFSIVPEFRELVGRGSAVTFPVQFSDHWVATADGNVARVLSQTPYSMGWAMLSMIRDSRNLGDMTLVNIAGQPVRASTESVISAMQDFANDSNSFDMINGPGLYSYPISTFNSIMIHTRSMQDCNKAKGLVEWIYWAQTDPQAAASVTREGVVIPTQCKLMKRRLLNLLVNVTCNGVPVSSLYGCVHDGVLCSDNGMCISNRCSCINERTGQFCQSYSLHDTNSNDALAISLGVGIPSAMLVVVLLCCIALLLRMKKSKKSDDWEIDINELNMGEALGVGGSGMVIKAQWKGTEVAVKTLACTKITKQMKKSFVKEVRTMTTLRHPNIVLFMAASSRPPCLCIVMEYMTLGSLFDLLHNDTIETIPFNLRLKMAYQAAKGMHFLHSSGIVHRNLKSHNLLLDSKWNIKVGDFGLAKFREDLRKKGSTSQTSIQWTAPEMLAESSDVDLSMADVYSFGIIMWELLTRELPYKGLSPAAVAIAVIRDGLRPSVTQMEDPLEYIETMNNCWLEEPTLRPSFLEIMTRLSEIFGTVSSDPQLSFKQRGEQNLYFEVRREAPSDSILEKKEDGYITVVFTDIAQAENLWKLNPVEMVQAILLHNQILRQLIKKYQGDAFAFTKAVCSADGSFCIAFYNLASALKFCSDVQSQLLLAPWPDAILQYNYYSGEISTSSTGTLFRGLRVGMGVHTMPGNCSTTKDTECTCTELGIAAHLVCLARGGQVLISEDVLKRNNINLHLHNSVRCLGKVECPYSSHGTIRVFELKVQGFEGRGDFEQKLGATPQTLNRAGLLQLSQGEEAHHHYFTPSSNLCQWIIDFSEIEFADNDQVGRGSYGIVFRGKWKGLEVAVKRLIKQKLNETRMLELRSETAVYSQLSHPNVVRFVGMCVKTPNLCLVTEFVNKGSLRTILLDRSTKLPYKLKLKLLYGAASGLAYLHSLVPEIIHQDLKSSNILVDENWNAKVADFGFGPIKEESNTMTYCCAPAWTAPEVIKGEPQNKSTNVYSFGVIIWEALTRRKPYKGSNFIGVCLDILEGHRPPIPGNCPRDIEKLMKSCWRSSAPKRPSMDHVVKTLHAMTTNFRKDDYDWEDQTAAPPV